jgi:hypothetical protein
VQHDEPVGARHLDPEGEGHPDPDEHAEEHERHEDR